MTVRITYGPVFSQFDFSQCRHLEFWVYRILTAFDPEDLSVTTAFYDPNTQSYPTGLTNYLRRWLEHFKVPAVFEGWPATPDPHEPDAEIFNFGPEAIVFRPDQVQAIRNSLAEYRGIFWMGTGAGKTEVALYVLLHLGLKSLFIVSTGQSVNDTIDRFRKRIDAAFEGGKISRKPTIGKVGEGAKEYDADIAVGLVESLYRGVRAKSPAIMGFLNSIGVLIYDEVHHEATAGTWKEVGIACPADYRYGLSATPFDNPYNPENLHVTDSEIVAMTGDVLVYVPEIFLIGKKALTKPIIRFFPGGGRVDGRITDWHEVYRLGVVENVRRNARIATVVANAVKCGGRVLVLIQRLRHGIEIVRLLQSIGIRAICSYGDNSTYIPNDPVLFQYAPWVPGESKTYPGFVRLPTSQYPMMELYRAGIAPVIVGSVIYDESKDIPIITDLVNAAAGKKARRVQQRIGRALRRHTFKRVAKVWDVADTCHNYLQAQSEARGHHAESLGYEVVWFDRLMSEHLMTHDWLRWIVKAGDGHESP